MNSETAILKKKKRDSYELHVKRLFLIKESMDAIQALNKIHDIEKFDNGILEAELILERIKRRLKEKKAANQLMNSEIIEDRGVF